MSAHAEVPVTFADGVRDDVARLIATANDALTASELGALKQRIAELLMECKANPHVGELMGSGKHPELADCRRVRFDVPAYKASRDFASSTETSHRTARPPSAAGLPSYRAPGCEPTARQHSDHDNHVDRGPRKRDHLVTQSCRLM